LQQFCDNLDIDDLLHPSPVSTNYLGPAVQFFSPVPIVPEIVIHPSLFFEQKKSLFSKPPTHNNILPSAQSKKINFFKKHRIVQRTVFI
jgi:hypothetical protein